MNSPSSQSIPLWLSAPISVLSWMLFSFFTVVCFILGLLICLPLSLLFSHKTRFWVHQVAIAWAKIIILTSPVWSLKVAGSEHVNPKKRYVIVANHQSLLDILVCLAGLPVPFKFLAKKELFILPFVGWHMSLSGYIPLDRSSRESGRQAILTARQWLSKGVSVLFYPEGTRSPDGNIQAFKMGAFKIAAEENVEILPIAIEGTGQAVPKKSWMLNALCHFKISIGKPVSVNRKNPEDLAQLKESVREGLIRQLDQMRAQ